MNALQHACLKTTCGKEFFLNGIRMSGDVHGLMLDMQVTQDFSNSMTSHAEVIYTFPLPWGAVLLSVEVTLGEKKLTGIVVKKKQAEAEYEEALSAGDTAVMLEKNSDHSYSLNLGNLAPQEHCRIFIRYAQTLQFEQNGLRLLIPTVIAPRYDGSKSYVPKRADIPEHLIPRHTLAADYPFNIELRLHDVLTQARIASPSHTVALVNRDGITYVSLNRQGTLDKDFVLALDQLPQNSIATIGTDYRESEQYAVLASFCPRIPPDMNAIVSVKILIDCSGSMAGNSITSARQALQSIVNNLNEGDYFSLSRFGDFVEHRSRSMWKAAPPSKFAAQRWIHGLEADLGGTEMEAALSSTFELNDVHQSDVLLITDGDITDINSVILSAKQSNHRLFIVGVGSSPSEIHLRRLADATGGACDFVGAGEAVEPAILRMFTRLRSPHLRTLTCVWPEDCTPTWTSDIKNSVFDGDTYHVFALLPKRPQGDLRLRGLRVGKEEPEEIGMLSLPSTLNSDSQVSRVTANARINSLSLIAIDRTEAEKIALDYQLITEYTNFLLIQERDEANKATDMPTLYQVKQMMPAGHSGIGYAKFKTSYAARVDTPSRIPAVFRRESTYDRTSMTQIDVANDIPAFLRKKPDDQHKLFIIESCPSSYGQRAQNLPNKSNSHWDKQEGQKMLSPLDLFTLLDVTPKRDWPINFADLRKININENVVDWLEFVILYESSEATEQIVVASFLKVMSDIETYLALVEQTRMKTRIRQFIHRAINKIKPLSRHERGGSVDKEIVERIRHSLRYLQTLHWPMEVNNLAAT